MVNIKLKNNELLHTAMNYEDIQDQLNEAVEQEDYFVWLDDYYIAVNQIVYVKNEDSKDSEDDSKDDSENIKDNNPEGFSFQSIRVKEIAEKLANVKPGINLSEILKNPPSFQPNIQVQKVDFPKLNKK